MMITGGGRLCTSSAPISVNITPMTFGMSNADFRNAEPERNSNTAASEADSDSLDGSCFAAAIARHLCK